MNTNSFILDYDFDGDINKLVLAIQNGEAIKYNGMSLPVKNAYAQGKQIVLPLLHKQITIDLIDIYRFLVSNEKVKITMNIVR